MCSRGTFFNNELPISETMMALEREAQRLAAEFEFSAADVNRGVKEFMREMGRAL